MTHFAQKKYLTDLTKLDSLILQDYSNINELYEGYQDKLVEIIDKNAPFKTLSKKRDMDNSSYLEFNKN